MKQSHLIPKDENYLMSDINIGDTLEDKKTGIKGEVSEITKHENRKGYYYEFYVLCKSFMGVLEEKRIKYTRFYKQN